MKNAQRLMREAEFDRSTRELDQAKSFWRTSDRPVDAEKELKETRSAYNKHLAEAKKHLEAKRLADARGEVETSRKWCPDSAEIARLTGDIAAAEQEEQRSRMEAEARRRKAKEAVGKFGKWSGIAIAGAAGIAGVIIIGAIFWYWAKNTAWPWCSDHLGTLVLVNVALAMVSACVHSARNTHDHIEHEFKGNFMGPVVLVGLIAVVSSLLAVFVFNGGWASGMTVGLLLGLGVSLSAVIYSFAAP